MNRRDFLRRSAILTAGVVAVDQLEILDRLGWTRSLFPSVAMHRVNGILLYDKQLKNGKVQYTDVFYSHDNAGNISFEVPAHVMSEKGVLLQPIIVDRWHFKTGNSQANG